MCESCADISEDINSFAGCEGIYYDSKDDQYYVVIEHFRGEINQTSINNCPWCGRKLK